MEALAWIVVGLGLLLASGLVFRTDTSLGRILLAVLALIPIMLLAFFDLI